MQYPIAELGEHGRLAGVGGPVYGGNPFGSVQEIAKVTCLGVHAWPPLIGIDIDDVRELFVGDLVAFPLSRAA